MSDRTERVRGCVDSQWRTTREIAETAQVGMPANTIYNTLLAEYRKGIYDRRRVSCPEGGFKTEWRLRA